MRLLLVRHGETEWNRESRVQGWAATGLTDRGHEQARELGTWLDRTHSVDRVISSDLERTRLTAAGVRETAPSVPEPTYQGALRERGFGVYQGFLAEELVARFPDHDRSESLLTLRIDPLNGESFETFVERVERAWDLLSSRVQAGETALVVTHGGVLKLLRAMLTDRDRREALSRDSPPNCSVTEVRLEGGEPTLVGYGATPWRD
jgi:probable phosphoglycerate mutase